MAWLGNKLTLQRVNEHNQKKNTFKHRFRLILFLFFVLTWDSVDSFEGTEHPHGPNGGQVDVLQVQRVLYHPREWTTQTMDKKKD